MAKQCLGCPYLIQFCTYRKNGSVQWRISHLLSKKKDNLFRKRETIYNRIGIEENCVFQTVFTKENRLTETWCWNVDLLSFSVERSCLIDALPCSIFSIWYTHCQTNLAKSLETLDVSYFPKTMLFDVIFVFPFFFWGFSSTIVNTFFIIYI